MASLFCLSRAVLAVTLALSCWDAGAKQRKLDGIVVLFVTSSASSNFGSWLLGCWC